MNRISNVGKTVFGTTGSTTDANQLYSILLDTRASTVSENMYDIAEKLMKNEKENSKIALEQLWALKKNLYGDNENTTVDMLISFYQDKLNILRNKEEHIKKISRDSRELLEEKRKRDSEIATVKQETSDCSREIERLTIKMNELNVKEQELSLIEGQLKKELELNANEVVNGLYEIILNSQETIDPDFTLDEELKEDSEDQLVEVDEKNEKLELDFSAFSQKNPDEKSSVPEAEIQSESLSYDETKPTIMPPSPPDYKKKSKTNFPVVEEKTKTETVQYPKSIVKTTKGIVLGEYYYDPQAPKDKRHYIYNSTFFKDRISNAIICLIEKYDKNIHVEANQCIEDAFSRISKFPNLHLEVSTNEILNENELKNLRLNMSRREYTEILTSCNRLNAKIKALGKNYIIMLTEQMNRFQEK